MPPKKHDLEKILASLDSSLDLTIHACQTIERLDRENRTALLVGDIDEVECNKMEAVIRELVNTIIPTAKSLLLAIEIGGVFEGDTRVATLQRNLQVFIRQHLPPSGYREDPI
ncbi:MAG: hypothetical protein Aurels2KO_26300 [Aureliella sp.]